MSPEISDLFNVLSNDDDFCPMLDGTLFIGVVIGAVLIGIAGVCFAPLFLRLNLAWAYDNGARLFDVFECWFGAVCFYADGCCSL